MTDPAGAGIYIYMLTFIGVYMLMGSMDPSWVMLSLSAVATL
jgi:hypothetical protein